MMSDEVGKLIKPPLDVPRIKLQEGRWCVFGRIVSPTKEYSLQLWAAQQYVAQRNFKPQ